MVHHSGAQTVGAVVSGPVAMPSACRMHVMSIPTTQQGPVLHSTRQQPRAGCGPAAGLLQGWKPQTCLGFSIPLQGRQDRSPREGAAAQQHTEHTHGTQLPIRGLQHKLKFKKKKKKGLRG